MHIAVHNAYCKVDGSYEELAWLRGILTVDVPGAKYTQIYRKRQWDGKKRFFNYLTKSFPTGLLDYVLKNGSGQVIKVLEQRHFPKFDATVPELKGIELRDYQIKAIESCFAKKNCLIQVATNGGKTAIIGAIVKQMQSMRCLLLTHREELLWQLKEMIETYTGIKLGVISAGEVDIRNVTIAMVPTLTNRLGSDDAITEYFESVNCLIGDEIHHAVSKTWAGIFSSCKAPYRFGFSGTIQPEGTLAGMTVRQWIGPVALQITNNDLIDREVSAKPIVTIHEMASGHLVHGLFNEAKTKLGAKASGAEILKEVYRNTMRKAIVENKERNEKAVDIIRKHQNKSVLLVVDILEHGRIVEKTLLDAGINCAFIHGDAEIRELALESFKKGLLKVLISTVIIDEGIDISRIESLILLAGKKSKRQLLQRIGRGLRRKDGANEVYVDDFADYGNKYLENHTRERIKVYKDEQFQIKFL